MSDDMQGIKDELTAQAASTIRLSAIQSANLMESIKSSLLIGPLKDALRCIICHDTIRVTPAHLALCCRQIICCGECRPQITATTCPHCRAENFRAIPLTAFDSVINILDSINAP